MSAPRPGYCRPDCKSCAVCSDGDPNGCPANLCCNPQTRTCCTPIANGSDPVCGFEPHGCCGDPALIEPCHAPGETPPPMSCPAPDCDQGFYCCQWCDGKLIETILP